MKTTIHLKTLTVVSALLFYVTASTAPAEVLISEAFDGLDTDNLNGKTPTFLDSAFTGSTWTAREGHFFQDGSLLDGSATGKAIINIGDFINDQKGNADAIFTVSLTGEVTKNWVGAGFFDSGASVTEIGIHNTPASTLFRRDQSDNADGYSTGPGVVKDNFAGTHSGEQTFGVTVDLTGWNGTDNFGFATFTLAGIDSTPYVFTSDKDFTFVGFSTATASNGQLSHFEFSQIPEPGTLWLVALGLTSVFFARTVSRRQNR
ncbi:MAG: PEP-CTERM sorting domain-containing protein [Kiritimatiellia bacterium]